MMWIAVGFVIVENVHVPNPRRPIWRASWHVSALRLARLVVGHIIATSGIAMTDDLSRFWTRCVAAPAGASW
jgi:putative membrane protein